MYKLFANNDVVTFTHLNFITDRTGPNISSRAINISSYKTLILDEEGYLTRETEIQPYVASLLFSYLDIGKNGGLDVVTLVATRLTTGQECSSFSLSMLNVR